MPAPEFLTPPILSLDARNIAGSDKISNVYLHDQYGGVLVYVGFTTQVITTIAPTASWIQAAEQQILQTTQPGWVMEGTVWYV